MKREGLRTEGLVIIKGGKIVYEKYAKGFDESKRHISWSVAKSISSALIGIATGTKNTGTAQRFIDWLKRTQNN